MKIKKHIPNAMTCANLVCGCSGLMFSVSLRLDLAFYAICIAALLDFFDGFTARMLKVTSPIGKDLDSLADMVTFGVLPGFIMYYMMALVLLNFQPDDTIDTYTLFKNDVESLQIGGQVRQGSERFLLPFFAMIIPVFSAIRLAKFNNDKRQSNSFIGVPTPANALLIGSLGWLLYQELMDLVEVESNYYLFFNLYSLVILTIVMSYLLIAEIPLFGLKFKSFKWKSNRIRYTFLISSLGLLILFQFTAIPFIIFLYVFLSFVSNVMHRIRTTDL